MKREKNLTCCSCGSNDLLLYCIKEYGNKRVYAYGCYNCNVTNYEVKKKVEGDK